MQLPMFAPVSNWRPPRISELPSWEGAKRVAIDTETNDKYLRQLGPGVRRGAYIAGYSFAIEDGPKHYVPVRHAGGDNVEDVRAAFEYLKYQAKNFKGEIVGAHLPYDLDFFAEEGVEFTSAKYFRDVQVAEALIDELKLSYSLESICQKYLGIGKNESLLREAALNYGVDPKKDMHLLPARFVGPYAEDDSGLPLLALRRQDNEIDNQDLWKIYNLESKLLPVLVKMRRKGIRVDLSRLEQVERWSVEEERKVLSEIKHLTGHTIHLNTIWTASVLVPALQSIGVQIPLTPKTKKPSIDKAWLASIKHPVADAIQRARRVNKVRTTFAQSVRDHITNGRIHCTINQLRSSEEDDEEGEGQGGRYGRCSSQNPNMQQQPARDPEIGPMWRSIYLPEEGKLWCSADYSSQEPRQAIHYAITTKLGRIRVTTPEGPLWVDADEIAAKVAERYRADLFIDPHQMMADMAGLLGKEGRKNAKEIYLGLSYGMGGPKLCRKLGLPTIFAVKDQESNFIFAADSENGKRLIEKGSRVFEAAGEEGQKLLDKFDAAVPFVRALSRICQKAASKMGYIRTAAGRKCRFPRDEFGNVDWAHKAFNRLNQGGAADQTKAAMIATYEAGFDLFLQVHDELAANVENREEGERMAKVMCECFPMAVPSRVDVEVGASWGEAK